MTGPPDISVIVRVRDEEANLRRCLEILASQRTGARRSEVIVVDCGATDGTAAVAEQAGARVLTLSRRAFSFGGALNLGCANARGELLVALSAHAFPPDDGWLARVVGPLADPLVACASGDAYGPDGSPLARPVLQDAALVQARPEWGYSNAAGAFRADLWRRRAFRADLSGCEDKEWAVHWLSQGFVCVIDPALAVDHDHTHDSLRRVYARARVEWEGLGSFLELGDYGARELASDWWSDTRWYRSTLKARLSHRRAARLLGAYAGRRRAKGPKGPRRSI
jgi:rhamnosyltransferase